MNSLLERLKFLFTGSRRGMGRRYYEQDARLYTDLMELSEREQRPLEQVQADLLRMALDQCLRHDDLHARWQGLSRREQEVCALTCLGLTDKQMASRLGIAVETVRTHLGHVLFKFNLRGRGELRQALEAWNFEGWE
jgi:DNA-binding CsgD family transcriptional regulator